MLPPPSLSAGYMSSGLARWKIVSALLPEYRRLIPLRGRQAAQVDAVLGWGLKPTAKKARRYAARHDLPYVALEDGFLRSLGLGAHNYQPHSLIVDFQGIYYDATRPSDLECLIRDSQCTPNDSRRAEHCMAKIRNNRLSKYNHAPDHPLPPNGKRRILVVDQTLGDASVTYGNADTQKFQHMLDRAISNNPGAEILVKVHPDVIAGKKKGYLAETARSLDCSLITDDLNPWALFDAVDEVHVVTSQLGFEALIAGKTVHCHGLPFFAGWGLTQDYQNCSRRGVTRSLTQVFAAAYLRYCRYANPYTGETSTLEETIDLIADQKCQRDRLAGHWVACDFSKWKRTFLPDFLGPNAHVRFARTASLPSSATSQERLLVWGQKATSELEARCLRHGQPLWRVEDGFIRSVGLGADLVRPLSLAIDARGLYYDATTPSDLECLLNETQFSQDLLARAVSLRHSLVELRLSKYNVTGKASPLPRDAIPNGKRVILVPGQVESDASIARGSPVIRTNRELLSAVRAEHPKAFILYKPHPDIVSGARLGTLNKKDHSLFDLEVADTDITDLFTLADEVHTMSSLTGFEALLRGLQVHTYGMPFYAGWGLTHDRLSHPRRTRRLGLDELVAGALLLYPVYVEPGTGHFCNAETAIRLVEQQRARGHGLPLKSRLYRLYRSLFSRGH